MYRVMLTRDYKYAKGIVWVQETRIKAYAYMIYGFWKFVQTMSAYPKTNLTIEKIEMGKIIKFPRRKF